MKNLVNNGQIHLGKGGRLHNQSMNKINDELEDSFPDKSSTRHCQVCHSKDHRTSDYKHISSVSLTPLDPFL